jgi:hypothetical protein
LIALRLSGLWAGLLSIGLCAATASGQRVEFPTPVADPNALAQAPAPATAVPSLGGATAPATPAWDPYANQGLPSSGNLPPSTATAPYTLPPSPSATPIYTPPPTLSTPPTYGPAPSYGAPSYGSPSFGAPNYGSPNYGPGPQYAAPTPYAAPSTAIPQPYYPANPGTPGFLYPNGGPVMAPGCGCAPPVIGTNFTRFMQEVRLDETFMYGEGPRRVESNDIETSATFALPVYWAKEPFLITPGFGIHTWERGTQTDQLPAQTYDAYIDGAWNPQPSPFFGAELGARVGVYSDFDTFTDHSIRIMGRALAVLNFSQFGLQTTQLKLGVIYLDRNEIKLLPAGGIFFTPDPDTRVEIYFPRPKYEHHFATTGTYQWWWYLVGEYGGGSWTFRRDIPVVGGGVDRVEDSFDYNDIRASIGIEWIPERNIGLRGYFEVGFATDREIVYRFYPPSNIDLPNTFLVRGGLAF